MHRGVFLLVLAACAGCSGGSEPIPEVAEGAEHIDCALGGSQDMKNACAVDRVKDGDALTLVVRHPDGGFRRFRVMSDGSGLAVADGAQEAVSKLDGDVLELAVDKDRYRFPVTTVNHADAP